MLSNLLTANMHLVIHGHGHVPFLSRYSSAVKTSEAEWTGLEQHMWIAGCGSIGGARSLLPDTMPKNAFSVYKLQEESVRVYMFEFNSVLNPTKYMEQVINW